MSIDSGSRETVLEWIRASGLLLVTVLGILLYIVFSVPATIFYGRLGTTPGEVGITYSSLLSGSTFGILVILVVLTLAFFAVSFIIAFFTLGFRTQRFVYRSRFTLDKFKGRSNWQLTDEEFEQRLTAQGEFATNFPEFVGVNWDEEEARRRRIRELRMMGVRSADQQAELDALTNEQNAVSLRGVFHATLAATETSSRLRYRSATAPTCLSRPPFPLAVLSLALARRRKRRLCG